MKLKNLLVGIIALSTAAVVGTSLATNVKSNEVEVSAATPSSYTNVYRFTVPHDFGSDVGNHIYLHAWGSSGGDTSWMNFITLSDYSYNENSERMYTYATNYTYTGFIIIRYNDNPDYCKTADIICGSDKAWSWNGAKGASASPWTPTNQTYYLYDYKNMFAGAKCYAWQSGGSLNNGDYPGVAMTSVQYGSGQLYSISLDPAFDKVIFGIGDSANTGDQWCNQHRGETFCWWDVGDSSWNNDLDWVKAHDWIYETMHVRDIPTETISDTGACRGANGYYNKAKTAYQNFSAAIKTKISEDECWGIAQARFIAWAKANGETVSSSETTLTVNQKTMPEVLQTSTSVITVVIVSVISITAIGGYFYFHKRKHN